MVVDGGDGGSEGGKITTTLVSVAGRKAVALLSVDWAAVEGQGGDGSGVRRFEVVVGIGIQLPGEGRR